MPIVELAPKRTWCGSLAGLPQYNENVYGHGKHRENAARVVESACAVDDEGRFEQGRVEFEGSDWFHEAVHDALSATSEDQPTIDDAIKGPEAEEWKRAIEEELTQIEKLGTWEIVDAPLDANIIDSRFVLHRKHDAQGNISQYKACLVAKGFKQQFGVDYTETFAPTVCPATLRVLFTIAGSLGNKVVIKQADAKNAYLNSWLHDDEVIFMALPQFYEIFQTLPAEFAKKLRKMIVLKL